MLRKVIISALFSILRSQNIEIIVSSGIYNASQLLINTSLGGINHRSQITPTINIVTFNDMQHPEWQPGLPTASRIAVLSCPDAANLQAVAMLRNTSVTILQTIDCLRRDDFDISTDGRNLLIDLMKLFALQAGDTRIIVLYDHLTDLPPLILHKLLALYWKSSISRISKYFVTEHPPDQERVIRILSNEVDVHSRTLIMCIFGSSMANMYESAYNSGLFGSSFRWIIYNRWIQPHFFLFFGREDKLRLPPDISILRSHLIQHDMVLSRSTINIEVIQQLNSTIVSLTNRVDLSTANQPTSPRIYVYSTQCSNGMICLRHVVTPADVNDSTIVGDLLPEIQSTEYNFFGQRLIIGLKDGSPPFQSKRETTSFYHTNVSGLTIDMLDEIARRLNFTYTLKEPYDHSWGSKVDGKWNGIVGEILNKTVDFGVGPFTITAIRSTAIEFTEPFMEDGLTMLIHAPTTSDMMFRVFGPFDRYMWLAICGSVLIIGVIMYIYSYISPLSYWNLGVDDRVKDEVRLWENIWAAIGSFLEQGQDYYPNAFSTRTVLAFWWGFTVIIFGFYTADLASFLTVYVPVSSITNLEDLIKSSDVEPLVKSNTNAHALFKEASPTTTYGRVFAKMSNMPVVTETDLAINMVINEGKWAYISDATQLTYRASRNCKQLLALPQKFNVASFGWPMPKNSPYAAAFNYHISKMKESGFIKKLVTKWWKSDVICTGERASGSALDMMTLSGPLIVTGIFYALGALLLCVELLYKRYFRRLDSNCMGITLYSHNNEDT